VSERRLRLGVAGLGRAFTLMVPTLTRHPRIEVVAGADPRAEARRRFEADFGARAHATVEALCADASVEAVYIATPHEHHAAHAVIAASQRKHLLVEKPMAVTLEEATRMIEAARAASVRLVVGPSHSFDAPIARARSIVESGEVGEVRMITAINYTDFLYRPRRPEELDTAKGGGVAFSQAAHQVDIARLIAGGRGAFVRALTGAWDRGRATEGAYAALVGFEGGAHATLAYSGYAHFDSDELCGGIGELGRPKSAAPAAARRALAGAGSREAQAKAARNYGGADYAPSEPAPWHEHFGLVIVSCERADLRPMPNGVMIYGDDAVRLDALPPPAVPRAEVIDELAAAVLDARPPRHDGEWGRATLEVCLAILESARRNADVRLRSQCALRPAEPR
jgi:phthalate 4,5-cis-dihydrodiol dehydrogenase